MSTRCWERKFLVPQLTREVIRLGSTVARLKLKGIDGDPHKRWMMWINSMQREQPYLPLTCLEGRREVVVPEREPEHRCCMAVVSLSLIHISEPTRLLSISYAVFCLKKK